MKLSSPFTTLLIVLSSSLTAVAGVIDRRLAGPELQSGPYSVRDVRYNALGVRSHDTNGIDRRAGLFGLGDFFGGGGGGGGLFDDGQNAAAAASPPPPPAPAPDPTPTTPDASSGTATSSATTSLSSLDAAADGASEAANEVIVN